MKTTVSAALVVAFGSMATAMDTDHSAHDHGAMQIEGPIKIVDAYARAATVNARSGAAFMMITNTGETDDTLIAFSTEASRREEIHTHIMTDDGVMQMRELQGGLDIAAGDTAVLQRGGDHLMMMGLTIPFEQGQMLEMTLTFETAGDVTIPVMIDNERAPRQATSGDHSGHGEMDHSSMGHGAADADG